MEDSQLGNRGGVTKDSSSESEKAGEKVLIGSRRLSVVDGEEVPQSSQEGTWARSQEGCKETIVHCSCQGREKSEDAVNCGLLRGRLT